MSLHLLKNYIFEEPEERPDDGPPPPRPITEAALAEAAGEGPATFAWCLTSGHDSWTRDTRVLASLSDPPIIDNLIREREVGSIVGASKTNKTWFALALALSVALGLPFLGLGTHRRRVLYLDYELKPGTFRKRLSMLAPEPPEGFFFQCLRGEGRLPTIDEIADIVEREGFGLVVVDSLYRTGWLSEENNNDSTPRDLAPLQDFTRRVSASLLCVDHTAKGGGADKSAVDAARGASAKGGFWDSILVLRPTNKGPDPEGNYAILDPVLRDWPRFDDLPLVAFHWTATTCEVTHAGKVDRNEPDALPTRILEQVAGADKGISCKAIAGILKTGDSTVRRHLEALVARSKVVEFPDPSHKQRILYRLPDLADPALEPQPHQTPPNHTAGARFLTQNHPTAL
jgi:hypothetical protein